MPVLGNHPVSEITASHVMEVLTPIWLAKPETARQVREHTSVIAEWAIGHGYRPDNPAGRAIIKSLPKQGQRVQHFRALPFTEVGAALEKVRATDAWWSTKACAEFLTLCAVRSGEARLATWDEIDWKSATWTIPASRMKAGLEHRVPLSDAAMDVLHRARELSDGILIFPSVTGKPMSDSTISKMLRENHVGTTPHGVRSSFRAWAAERDVCRQRRADGVGQDGDDERGHGVHLLRRRLQLRRHRYREHAVDREDRHAARVGQGDAQARHHRGDGTTVGVESRPRRGQAHVHAGVNANGHARFTFKVSDGTDESASASAMTVDVTAVNDAATGEPTIFGASWVGQTVTAETSGIADSDGLTGTFSYQWILVDGTNETDISGATPGTYTLAADQGKKVKVKVSFTDNDGTSETLTSGAFPWSDSVESATTQTADEIWSATLRVHTTQYEKSCNSQDSRGKCTSQLNDKDFTLAGDRYTFQRIAYRNALHIKFEYEGELLTRGAPEPDAVCGRRQLPHQDRRGRSRRTHRYLGKQRHPVSPWYHGKRVNLRLTAPKAGTPSAPRSLVATGAHRKGESDLVGAGDRRRRRDFRLRVPPCRGRLGRGRHALDLGRQGCEVNGDGAHQWRRLRLRGARGQPQARARQPPRPGHR